MEQLKELMNDGQLSIVDGMIDWVRVIDKTNTIVYANKKMREELGDNIVGKQCYEVLGKTKKCEDCISHQTILTGVVRKKEEIYGNRAYNVISSPMVDKNKDIIGSVEVFRDITIEKKLAKSITEKNKKMSDDIDFAKNMQKRMLPLKGTYNGFSIDYLYEASESLSGDFFDIFKIDKDTTGIYICDVVGHGITASLLTVFVRQSLRSIAKGKSNANKIVSDLHKMFLGLNLDSDKYFSVFFGMYNKSTRQFNYVNAGHNSIPILLKSEDKNINLLEAKGYPICNIFDTVEYDINTVNLQNGDKIFFYTDGITETKDDDGEEYGIDKLIEIIKSEDKILHNVKKSLDSYANGQKDDYALMMVEII